MDAGASLDLTRSSEAGPMNLNAVQHASDTVSATTPASSPASPVMYRVARGPAGVSCWAHYPYGVRRPIRHVRRHSSALEVGYVGSGPADLALSILADFLGHAHLERGLYWAFMVAFLSNDGPAVRDLRTTDIAAWIDAQPNGVRS